MIHTLYPPAREHECGPNRHRYWHEGWNDPAGTVRECDQCRRSWVAYRPADPGYMGVLWRREGRFARWRRRRRARAAAAQAPGI